MGYIMQEGKRAGCLAGMAGYKRACVDMTEGNDSYTDNGYNEEAHHRVMDLMEMDLGVQFNAAERKGQIDVGYGASNTRRESHLKLLPFRVFFESGTTRKAQWFKEWGNNWGAFIALHGVDSNWGGIKPAFRGDQQWFLNHYISYRSEDTPLALRLNAYNIVKRTAALFETLDHELTRNFMTTRANSSNMGLNSAKIITGSPLHAIVDRLEGDYAGIYGSIIHSARNAPARTPEQMIAESAVYQKMFEAVRTLAYDKATHVPAPNGFNSEALAILSGRQPAPTQPVYAEAV